MRGRIFNVHVRRATMGGLAPENTHPFCLGSYSFCHNGTILRYPRLLDEPGVSAPAGRHRLRAALQLPDGDYDAARPDRVAAPRRAARRSSARPSPASTSCSPTASASTPTGSACSTCTGCTGPGSCWWRRRRSPARPGTACSRTCCWCSTPTISRSPTPSACVGDELLREAEIRKIDTSAHLRGDERGAVAAERARGRSRDASEPPLRAAGQPGLRRREGPRRRSRPCTPSSTASAPPTAR